MIALSVAAAPAYASSPPSGEHTAPAEGVASPRTDLLDLGSFRIRSSQPTDREVIDIQFGVYFVLSSKASTADFRRLEHWKNRLRDQVIIAVRSATSADYNDPELRRLQRLIMFRVKRLEVGDKIIGIYLTDFSLDRGETLEDVMIAPVTPSATPAKPSGGGH